MQFQRRGGRKRVVTPDGTAIVPTSKPQPDGTLVNALARAWRWQKLLGNDVYTSGTEISEAEGINKSYVSRILRVALATAEQTGRRGAKPGRRPSSVCARRPGDARPRGRDAPAPSSLPRLGPQTVVGGQCRKRARLIA
jgi:hypothetical protein